MNKERDLTHLSPDLCLKWRHNWTKFATQTVHKITNIDCDEVVLIYDRVGKNWGRIFIRMRDVLRKNRMNAAVWKWKTGNVEITVSLWKGANSGGVGRRWGALHTTVYNVIIDAS